MTAPRAVPTTPLLAPGRMTLASIRKGRLQMPLRILLYGVEGVGKSTFAAGAPGAVFMGADNGTGHLDIVRLPEPRTWDEVLEAPRVLQREAHDFHTFVLDPVNWMEALLFEHLCRKHDWTTIEDAGYGKGYTAAVDCWRELIVELERLWMARGMNIVLVAHSQTKTFRNPEGEDYERYNIALHEKAAGVLKQWCDLVLFTKHEAFAKKDGKTKRVRGVATGARMIYTTWTAAYDAKNRHNLPDELPLSWKAFDDALQSGKARASEIRARIEAIIAEIADDAVTARAKAYLEEAGDDVTQLADIVNAAELKLEEKRQAAALPTTETRGNEDHGAKN